MPPSRYISIGIRVSVASVLVIEVTLLTRIPGTVVCMYFTDIYEPEKLVDGDNLYR